MMIFFSFLLAATSTVLARPCGLQGTIEERMKDCAVTKENFALIYNDDKGVEVYQDLKSKLIWGSRLMMDFNHYGSAKACADAPEATALKEMRWRLPTVKEFEKSASHGMKAILPNMNRWFWTSTPVKMPRRRRRRQPSRAFLWDGVEEKTDTGDLKDAASVRCVANG